MDEQAVVKTLVSEVWERFDKYYKADPHPVSAGLKALKKTMFVELTRELGEELGIDNAGKKAAAVQKGYKAGSRVGKEVYKLLSKELQKKIESKALSAASKRVISRIERVALMNVADEMKKAAIKLAEKAAGKAATKGGQAAAKSITKKIPLIGLGFGAIFAIGRIIEGEYGKAALELASGAASTVPGWGTAASVAIDVGLAAADIGEAFFSDDPEQMKVALLLKVFWVKEAFYDGTLTLEVYLEYLFEKVYDKFRYSTNGSDADKHASYISAMVKFLIEDVCECTVEDIVEEMSNQGFSGVQCDKVRYKLY